MLYALVSPNGKEEQCAFLVKSVRQPFHLNIGFLFKIGGDRYEWGQLRMSMLVPVPLLTPHPQKLSY